MKNESPGTRLLTRSDVARLLPLGECIVAVERALVALAEGRAVPPGVLSAHVDGGAFHVKAAGLTAGRPTYAAKLNGNFHGNVESLGLPRIQGVVILCDARNGTPLAVMDSMEITALRTAAATAVAARHLARADSETATIVGCGIQGGIQLAALRLVRPIRKVFLVDCEPARAKRLAAAVRGEIEAVPVPLAELAGAARHSDVCITCTPSREPLLGRDDVPPGAFVAAVGSDSEEKQELEPELLRISKLVVDHLEQCATIGELHHALDRGVLSLADVHAELHEIVAGRKPGRTEGHERIVFDSTGIALEDVAAAARVYERALAEDAGRVIEFGS